MHLNEFKDVLSVLILAVYPSAKIEVTELQKDFQIDINFTFGRRMKGRIPKEGNFDEVVYIIKDFIHMATEMLMDRAYSETYEG